MGSPRKTRRARRMLNRALRNLGSAPGALGAMDAKTVLGLALHGDEGPGRIQAGSTTAGLISKSSTLMAGLDDPNLYTKAVARLETKTSTPADLAGEWIYIVSADGTGITYAFDVSGAFLTGAEISADTGFDGSPIVCIQIQLAAAPLDINAQIKAAIEDVTNGHGARIECTLNPGNAGTEFVLLEQQVAGTAGNKSIGTDVANAHIAIPTSFYGGLDTIAAGTPRWQMSDTPKGPTTVPPSNTAFTTGDLAAELGSLSAGPAIASEGLVFSPNGPLAKYIPALENVSATVEHSVLIVPGTWTGSGGRWCVLKVHGATTATNDTLAIDGVNAAPALTVLADHGLNVVARSATPMHGALDLSAVVHEHTDNASAIAVTWDRNETGTAALDGWVIRFASGTPTYHP